MELGMIGLGRMGGMPSRKLSSFAARQRHQPAVGGGRVGLQEYRAADTNNVSSRPRHLGDISLLDAPIHRDFHLRESAAQLFDFIHNLRQEFGAVEARMHCHEEDTVNLAGEGQHG